MKVFVVGPSWVGDTMMSQALFKILRQQDQTVEIDVAAPAWSFPILSRMPEVRKSIALPFKHGEFRPLDRYRFGKSLRHEQYDWAIVLPNSFKSAIIPWAAGIPRRTGYRREFRYGLLNDMRQLDNKRYPLLIEQYMALGLPPDADLKPPYPLPALQGDYAAGHACAEKLNLTLTGAPILALSPGGEYGPAKRWPEEYFAEIARQKLAEGWQVWILGSPKDQVIAQKIMALCQHPSLKDLTACLNLADCIDVLCLVSGLVTNDSGLMHIAAALGKPIIALYGSTSPGYTPPLAAHAKILKLNLPCQPCFERTCPLVHHRCMRDLQPEQVLSAMSTWGNQ